MVCRTAPTSIAVKHLNATTESIWMLNQFCFGMDTYWFEKIKDRDQKQNSQRFCLLRNKMLSCLVAFNKEILLDRITNAIQFATSIKQWRVPLLTLLLPFLKYAHCTGLNSFLKSIFYLYSFSILLDISSTFSTKSIAGFL